MMRFRLLVGFAVPIVSLTIGVLGRKLARDPGWSASDFWVVDQLTLAACGEVIGSIFSAADHSSPGVPPGAAVTGNLVLLVIVLPIHLFGQTLWQDHVPQLPGFRKVIFVRLLLVSDIVGLAVLGAASVLLVS